MLESYPVRATIPCSDFERAKSWYKEHLGLSPVSEDPGGAYFECGDGTGFALFHTAFAGTAKNTQMEWSVPDLKATVEELKSNGVVFDHPDMGDAVHYDGDIAVMGPFKGSWFRDSEGNTIGITEQIPG
jgi:catechol 2,3-dioxygenase-like lactoylglutathione lyase family enzyme